VSESTNGSTSATVPEPVVKIDNERDPFATVVTIEYGDRLGELLDTVGSRHATALPLPSLNAQAAAVATWHARLFCL
jgi:hypothetical protein